MLPMRSSESNEIFPTLSLTVLPLPVDFQEMKTVQRRTFQVAHLLVSIVPIQISRGFWSGFQHSSSSTAIRGAPTWPPTRHGELSGPMSC